MKRRDRGWKGRRRGAGRIHRAVPEERIENAGQAAGERDDGDVLASAGGDAQGPRPEGLGRGGPAAQDRDRGLDEQPAVVATMTTDGLGHAEVELAAGIYTFTETFAPGGPYEPLPVLTVTLNQNQGRASKTSRSSLREVSACVRTTRRAGANTA